jgi:beta-glucosidase
MLRDFERVKLNPGQTKTIRFPISPEDLSILDKSMKWVVEPGKFEIQIGSSSATIHLKTEILVE